MRKTEANPLLKKSRKLSRPRSAPKRISTSKNERLKGVSKISMASREEPSVKLLPRISHPDQFPELQRAGEYRSIVPPSVPQWDPRIAHPDQFKRLYRRPIPFQNVEVMDEGDFSVDRYSDG